MFSGFQHILEVVTLDSTLCPDLIDELQSEDWEHNVHEDFRTEFFRDADYLMARQSLDGAKHQVIAALECPPEQPAIPHGFVTCGFDIVDSCFGISTLTNCGQIPEVFKPTEVNLFGLIDDRDRAFAICDAMQRLQPDEPHMSNCQVWLLARLVPATG